ncbi:hypothetical protein Tco_0060703 [Tanacetum coccineum]
MKGRPGHLTVAVEYFFNNDLEFLKSSDPEKKYTTSITKIKAARYEIVGIEYMTPTLWSTIKHGYDKDAEKGIKHWGKSKILGVKSVSVQKLHGYGHLEEIVVKRADRQLYKFKEGDFVDLHLNDIEYMLLLAVQHKLFHLNGSDIVDFIVALVCSQEVLSSKDCSRIYSLVSSRRDTQDCSLRASRRTLDFSSRNNRRRCLGEVTDQTKGRPELMSRLLTSRCGKEGSFRIWSDWLVLGTSRWTTN